MKKILLVLLAIMMMIPVMSATAEEMPAVSVLIACDSEVPVEDASIVQAMRDATGVNVQPIYISRNDLSSRMSAYIASGNLPDIMVLGNVDATELVTYGALLDLTPYLESAANIQEDGADLTFGINSSGNGIFGLPQGRSYPWMMAVRRDWMQNLGYEVGDEYVIQMTIDEFKQLMYDFTHGDPDGDGAADTFGFCMEDGSFGMYAPIFTAYGIPADGWESLWYDEEADTLKSIAKHPRFLEAVESFRYFYQNGCFDTEFAVVADASTEFQFLWNGTAGGAAWAPPGATNNWLPRYTEEHVEANTFVYIDITDNEGNFGGCISKYNGNWVCVAASCQNPEAAVKFIDYLYSEEGTALAYAGIEGYHWQWIDKDNGQFEYINEFTDISKQRADGGWLFWNHIRPEDSFELFTLTPITAAAVQYGNAHQVEGAVIYYGTPAIASELGSTLTDTIIEMTVNMIVAEGDVTEMYNQYIAEYDAIGGLTYEAEATAIWKAENGIA